MNNCIFAADLHLQPCAWRGRASLRGDAYYALDQLVELSQRYGCPIVLGGDIFDSSRPDPESAERFRRFCTHVTGIGQQVWHILGNHDASDPGWPDVLGSLRLRGHGLVNGIRFYGLDYTPRSQLRAELSKVPADSILICHLAWKELAGGAHWEGSLVDVPCRHVLSGDLHKRMMIHEPRLAFSPGSTCMQSIDEEHEKTVLYLDTTGGAVTGRMLPLRSRPVYRLKAMTAQMLDEACVWLQTPGNRPVDATLPQEIQQPIVQVEYDPSLPRVSERLNLSAGQGVHLFLTARSRGNDDVVVSMSRPKVALATLDMFATVAQTAAPADADALVELLRAATGSKQQVEALLKERRAAFLKNPALQPQPVVGQCV